MERHLTARAGLLFVLAGSYGQYEHYCYEHRLHPRHEALYVRNVQDVCGIPDGVRYALYGEWDWRREVELDGVLEHLRRHQAVEVRDEG